MTTPTPSPEAEALPTLPVVAWCELTRGGTIAYFDGKPMVMPGSVGNDCHPVALTPQAPAEAAIVALRAERDEAYSARDAAINLANSRFDSMRAAQAEVAELRKDAERLDWLSLTPASVVADEVMRAWLWKRPAGFDGIRRTIDAARASLLGDGGTL